MLLITNDLEGGTRSGEPEWSVGSFCFEISRWKIGWDASACNRCKEREILTGRSRDVFRWFSIPQVCPSVSLSGCHHQFCTLASVKTLTLLLLRGWPRVINFDERSKPNEKFVPIFSNNQLLVLCAKLVSDRDHWYPIAIVTIYKLCAQFAK